MNPVTSSFLQLGCGRSMFHHLAPQILKSDSLKPIHWILQWREGGSKVGCYRCVYGPALTIVSFHPNAKGSTSVKRTKAVFVRRSQKFGPNPRWTKTPPPHTHPPILPKTNKSQSGSFGGAGAFISARCGWHFSAGVLLNSC